MDAVTKAVQRGKRGRAMRLIDADALIDTLGISDEDIDFKEILGDAPTIEAEPVVRCKDCKYARNIESEWICEHLSGTAGLNVLVNDNDFCSYGERREP